ncbi:helix-turn-helix domain-containing protein [Algoriphagus sp. A40]|uniref:helix-turn-helix domain-containing protein n=1 Tax=Algoriphagus sp. A40 TaxID=1945863 RepID=UPI00111567EC|nr:helix-turn-helix transcriptional regulator [Algoriphagus sp. A40]
MKQPQLGKKISELRKAKGLTQEELVEKCNLNVRTIQRIEAGEVTPRSYTVKALFEALEYQWEEAKNGFADEERKVPAYLYFAFAAGLVYFFLAFFEIGMEYEWFEGGAKADSSAFIGVKIGTFLTYAAFIYGWIRLESFIPNFVLKIALWTMLGANVIWYSVDCYSLLSGKFSLEDYYLVKMSAFGLCYTFLGIGYLTYKKLWSNIPQIVGALGLIAGILIFSGIGVIFGLIPLTLFEIGQLGLMIWAINKIGRTSSPDYSPESVSA